ncbi:PREDICTED: E1A-binding protein p400-like isoform X2 [Haliaeetus leucocephalus]|uniref:E1A-binding protein p400-like isoform X2 n=1 Tax=Haliaeetus leucocephalus TaxID=52644 RepID=UPI00053CD4A0|nr:PREDICTED: E1A-binding protein p400-like isoform X2 [Haliaeetus leucocephalus]
MVPSQLEQLASFVDQLKPIEKYALNFLELFHTLNDQKSQTVNKELKTANIKWEYRHPRELEKAEEKFQQEVELLTYTRQDAYNTEFVCEGPDGEVEVMPLWTPPVVPENHNDVYTDSVMCLMYTSTPIPESKLPPLFVRKACKRQRTDLLSSGESKKHCCRRMVAPPPSLFDQVTPRILNTRQKSKAQKTLLWVKQKMYFARPLSALINAAADTRQDSPAWLIAEDLALLKNTGGYPLRVRQAYAKDKNSERSQIYMNHFELMTMTTRKRSSSNRFLAENYDKLLPMSEVVSICAEPMTMQEKALTEEQIAPQLQEQQPSQKQEEEQTMEQTQTRCQPQRETQALGRTLSAVVAALQQVSVVPAIPAQLQPSTPSQFFQAEAFDSISCNHHSDGNCADGF